MLVTKFPCGWHFRPFRIRRSCTNIEDYSDAKRLQQMLQQNAATKCCNKMLQQNAATKFKKSKDLKNPRKKKDIRYLAVWDRNEVYNKVGCVFHMVVVSMLPHAEFKLIGHRKDVSHLTQRILVAVQVTSTNSILDCN